MWSIHDLNYWHMHIVDTCRMMYTTRLKMPLSEMASRESVEAMLLDAVVKLSDF